MTRLKFYLVRNHPWGDGIEFRVFAKTTDGPMAVPVSGVDFRVRDRSEDGAIVPPLFQMDMNSAQDLMDELWGCGIRPTEGTGSAGSLRATERHLEDMRALVFKTEVKL